MLALLMIRTAFHHLLDVLHLLTHSIINSKLSTSIITFLFLTTLVHDATVHASDSFFRVQSRAQCKLISSPTYVTISAEVKAATHGPT